MRWTFHRGSGGSTRTDGLRFVACLRHFEDAPNPGLTTSSIAMAMDEVAWEVMFPARRCVRVPWSETRATAKDMEVYCDERWPEGEQR